MCIYEQERNSQTEVVNNAQDNIFLRHCELALSHGRRFKNNLHLPNGWRLSRVATSALWLLF
jgi:hypothetical protein